MIKKQSKARGSLHGFFKYMWAMGVWSFLYSVLFLFFAHQAVATGLTVFPYRVVVTSPAKTGVFNLSNSSGTTMNVQLRVYRWQQIDGEDVYTPSPDIVVNPPMLRIKPGVEQQVRIIRISKSPILKEEAFRIFADELPPDISVRKPNEVVFVSRYIFPAFFEPKTAIKPDVTWSASQHGATITLKAVNSGNGHMKISDVKIFSGSLQIASQKNLVGYVLPASTMSFQLKSRGGKPTSMTFKNYDQTIKVDL